VHSKVVVLAAEFGEQFHHRVYTGSHNWTHSANYDNDEVFVRMAAETETSHPLYDAFHGHFNDAYDAGSPM
jgi:phosphatidylserine/phosphatidylglycerophosphate/cardiolipin synthase-like enzyme